MNHEAIKKWREHRSFNQTEMAKRIKISQNALSRIEHGKVKQLQEATMKKMVLAYGVKREQIAGLAVWDPMPVWMRDKT